MNSFFTELDSKGMIGLSYGVFYADRQYTPLRRRGLMIIQHKFCQRPEWQKMSYDQKTDFLAEFELLIWKKVTDSLQPDFPSNTRRTKCIQYSTEIYTRCMNLDPTVIKCEKVKDMASLLLSGKIKCENYIYTNPIELYPNRYAKILETIMKRRNVKMNTKKITGIKCPHCGESEGLMDTVQKCCLDEMPHTIYTCLKCLKHMAM